MLLLASVQLDPGQGRWPSRTSRSPGGLRRESTESTLLSVRKCFYAQQGLSQVSLLAVDRQDGPESLGGGGCPFGPSAIVPTAWQSQASAERPRRLPAGEGSDPDHTMPGVGWVSSRCVGGRGNPGAFNGPVHLCFVGLAHSCSPIRVRPTWVGENTHTLYMASA